MIWVLLYPLIYLGSGDGGKRGGPRALSPGAFNLLIAVAVAQAALLGVFFMELRQASVLILVTAGAGFVFLLAMAVLTLDDLFSRF